MQTLLDPGDEVIIIAPYWLTYPELVKIADGVPVYVTGREEDDFQPALGDIEAAVSDRTRAVIVNSPSNPCGCVYKTGTLKGIAEIAKKYDLAIISDEIYDVMDYMGQGGTIAGVSEDAKERTIVVNGMSKAYAMTGWRIGYTIAPKAFAKAMGSLQSQMTSNPCSISQCASVEALHDHADLIERMVGVFKKRSEMMYELINDIPLLSCRQPEGAFYALVNITGSHRKERMHEGKADRRVCQVCGAAAPKRARGGCSRRSLRRDDFVRLSYAGLTSKILNQADRRI